MHNTKLFHHDIVATVNIWTLCSVWHLFRRALFIYLWAAPFLKKRKSLQKMVLKAKSIQKITERVSCWGTVSEKEEILYLSPFFPFSIAKGSPADRIKGRKGLDIILIETMSGQLFVQKKNTTTVILLDKFWMKVYLSQFLESEVCILTSPSIKHSKIIHFNIFHPFYGQRWLEMLQTRLGPFKYYHLKKTLSELWKYMWVGIWKSLTIDFRNI